MDIQTLLLPIVLEHIGSASIVPFVPSVTLETMLLMGGYESMLLPALAAVLGSVIGCGANWGVGRAIAWLRARTQVLGSETFPAAERFFQTYGFALAAFYWLPLGSVLVVIAGFFRVPLWKVLLASMVGAAMHIATVVS
jgi:membrane protein YqaA with SNARE-associated domain